MIKPIKRKRTKTIEKLKKAKLHQEVLELKRFFCEHGDILSRMAKWQKVLDADGNFVKVLEPGEEYELKEGEYFYER